MSGLVNEFAKHDGLRSSQEVALRRLTLERSPDVEYKDIIQPDEVTTWVDIDGSEQPIGPSSWANVMEAKACAKICDHLIRIAPRKSVVVVVLFSLTRNNPERNVGAAGTLQDINVAISRAKEKLIILGNFDMMLNGWTSSPNCTKYYYKSQARNLARLIESKYGKIVDPLPQLLVH